MKEKPSKPFVSIIIPVYNDCDRLKICLQSLEKQTYPHDQYNIIVVDNGSDDNQDVKNIVASFEQALAIEEKTPGSYAARNRGIASAKGDILAFTDADCIPAPNWIEKGVENLRSVPNCGLVAGKIERFFRNRDRLTVIELHDSLFCLRQKFNIEQEQYGATANLFIWREIIEKVGRFNHHLKSSGDKEFGKRVALFGYQLIYAEDTIIAHPARHSLKEFHRKVIRIAGGEYDLVNCQESSFLRKQLKISLSILKNLIPPVMYFGLVWFDQRITQVNHKLLIPLLEWYRRYVTAWETTCLMLGDTSFRG